MIEELKGSWDLIIMGIVFSVIGFAHLIFYFLMVR